MGHGHPSFLEELRRDLPTNHYLDLIIIGLAPIYHIMIDLITAALTLGILPKPIHNF